MVPLTFRHGVVCCVDASVELGWKRENYGAVLVVGKVQDAPVIFLDGESMYPSEMKSQVRELLATRDPADLEESLPVAPEEVPNIEGLASGLDWEADWDLANLSGDPDSVS